MGRDLGGKTRGATPRRAGALARPMHGTASKAIITTLGLVVGLLLMWGVLVVG